MERIEQVQNLNKILLAEMPEYTHTTGDMQKRASEIVGDFLTDIFGEELKPWEENAKMARAQSA